MGFLIAAVVLVGALGVLNLLLTVTVLRQFAEFRTRGAAHGYGDQPAFPDLLGRPVPPFRAVTTTGTPLDGRELAAGVPLIGFFSTGCGACHDEAPAFARYAAAELPDGANGLAVVVGSAAEAADLIGALAPAVHVVVEDDDGEISGGFGVRAFPALLALDAGGRVAAAEPTVHSLTAALRRAPSVPVP